MEFFYIKRKRRLLCIRKLLEMLVVVMLMVHSASWTRSFFGDYCTYVVPTKSFNCFYSLQNSKTVFGLKDNNWNDLLVLPPILHNALTYNTRIKVNVLGNRLPVTKCKHLVKSGIINKSFSVQVRDLFFNTREVKDILQPNHIILISSPSLIHIIIYCEMDII